MVLTTPGAHPAWQWWHACEIHRLDTTSPAAQAPLCQAGESRKRTRVLDVPRKQGNPHPTNNGRRTNNRMRRAVTQHNGYSQPTWRNSTPNHTLQATTSPPPRFETKNPTWLGGGVGVERSVVWCNMRSMHPHVHLLHQLRTTLTVLVSIPSSISQDLAKVGQCCEVSRHFDWWAI